MLLCYPKRLKLQIFSFSISFLRQRGNSIEKNTPIGPVILNRVECDSVAFTFTLKIY